MNSMVFTKSPKLSRRKFIVGSAAVAGGGLVLGLKVPFGVDAAQAQNAATEVNIWVAIKPDDTCVIRIARSEMGQGTLTGIAQLVAEELECDWNKVATRASRRAAISRASGPGAKWAPAAAAAYAPRRIMSGVAAPRHA